MFTQKRNLYNWPPKVFRIHVNIARIRVSNKNLQFKSIRYTDRHFYTGEDKYFFWMELHFHHSVVCIDFWQKNLARLVNWAEIVLTDRAVRVEFLHSAAAAHVILTGNFRAYSTWREVYLYRLAEQLRSYEKPDWSVTFSSRVDFY